MILICQRCKKEFKNSHKTRKHCSDDCRYPPILIECSYCGKKRRIKPYALKISQKKGHVIYCSEKCFALALKGRPSLLDKRITKICKECGKSFKIKRNEIKRGKGIYCSLECYRIVHAREGLSKETKEKIRQNHILSKRYVGEKNPAYNGGKIKLKSQIRRCYKYKEWRKAIFERDNYTCRICNIPSKGNIEADHYPQSFAFLIYIFKIKTLEEALNCEALWTTGNGRTLCRECHKKTDTYLKPLPDGAALLFVFNVLKRNKFSFER